MTMVQHFSQLTTWQKHRQIVLIVYKLTRDFPNNELFGMTSQLRRSVVSIISNIAEGYGRFGYKDKIRFYYIARGSNTETQNHLIISRDLGFISQSNFETVFELLIEGQKMINALIKTTGNFPNNS